MKAASRGKRFALLGIGIPALILQLVFVPATVVAAIPPSTFEANDGDLTPGAGTDWSNLGSVSVGTDPSSHNGDNSFKKGSKENHACGTIATHSVPPNKADIIRFYVGGESIASQNFAYVAWVRDDAHGDVNFTVEFNQSTLFCPNGVQPQKTVGDILFEFQIHPGSFNGSPGTLVPRIRTWTGTQWSSPSPVGPNAEGSINSQGPVPDPIAGGVLDTSDFGELSINLSALAGDLCFNNAIIKSRASRSFTSALKDFAGPAAIQVGACTPPAPNLVAKKTVTTDVPGQAQPDETIEYAILVKNTGNADAPNVTISDDIADVLTQSVFQACSDSCAGAPNGPLTWDLGTLAAGAERTVTFSVKLNTVLTASEIRNTVVVPNSNCVVGSGDPDCTVITLLPPPDPTCTWFFGSAGVGTTFRVGDVWQDGTFTYIEDNTLIRVRMEADGSVIGRFRFGPDPIDPSDEATITFANPINVTAILWHGNRPTPPDLGWSFNGIPAPITGNTGVTTPVNLTAQTITMFGAGGESGGLDFCFIPD